MTLFSDRLFDAVDRIGTPLCVGFDPHLHLLPKGMLDQYTIKTGDPLYGTALAVEEYLLRILDAITGLVPVIKPQFAFFERLGHHGMRILERLCMEARQRDILVLGDAKRGDIGSTAAAYAGAYFADTNAQLPTPVPLDAITLNPYLGIDSIQPFLKVNNGQGVFILVKTSNPSGREFQDIETMDKRNLAFHIADKVAEWGRDRIGRHGYSDVGAVVGATYPEEARQLREQMPNTPFLIPGYGAQGAGAQDATVSFDRNRRGGIINSSRGILFAYRMEPFDKEFGESQYAEASAAACRAAAEEIRGCLYGG